MARRMALDAQPRLDAGAAPPLDGAPSPMKRAFSPAVGSRHQQISPPAKRPQAANPPPPSTVQGHSHRQRQERAKPTRAKGQRAPAAGADLAALDPGARLCNARNAPAEDPYKMRRSVFFGLPASRGGAWRRGPGQPSVQARASGKSGQNRSKSPETARETAQKRLRNGQDQVGRNSTHGVDVVERHGGWHPWRTLGCTNIGLPVHGCPGA